MSEGSDKNGYHFPYTAEEDHLPQGHHTVPRSMPHHILGHDVNNPGTLGSRHSSRHGSRASSPPAVAVPIMQPLAPLTSITDTSE